MHIFPFLSSHSTIDFRFVEFRYRVEALKISHINFLFSFGAQNIIFVRVYH